jgi:hypothetical protein
MKFTGCDILPLITKVSLQNVTFTDTITITGTGFSSNSCENQILIGSYLCPLTSSSTTQLSCVIGPNSGLDPSLAYSIEVLVKNIGLALKKDNFQINYFAKVTSLLPIIGSTGGGTNVIISGDGFIPDRTLIQIGPNVYSNGKNAQITNSSISLQTLPGDPENFDVYIYVKNVLAICESCYFEYSDMITPTVTSISPSSIDSGSLMTIKGSRFGSDMSIVKVRIGKQNCAMVSLSTDTLTCQLDGLSLGSQLVTVSIDGIKINCIIWNLF